MHVTGRVLTWQDYARYSRTTHATGLRTLQQDYSCYKAAYATGITHTATGLLMLQVPQTGYMATQVTASIHAAGLRTLQDCSRYRYHSRCRYHE